jgi:hypothetical protein
VRFRIVSGCPCPASIAPYVYLVLREAGLTAASIYRGEDAKALLHRHGKSTQAEIHRQLPAISNPPGFSQHELRSDGVGNPRVGRGGRLEEWQVGVDAGSDSPADASRIERAARRLGWRVRHPYARGVEAHHFCFAVQPKPRGLRQRARIIHLRATLPRR